MYGIQQMVTLRSWAEHDSLDALTALLHRAYARLGAMGLNYTAVDQSVETTRRRITAGRCQVAEHEGVIVGTVTVKPPHDVLRDAWAAATEWYVRHDVASFGQLGVEPACHGQGIGQRLIGWCADWAREHGYRWLALDTAMPATHLRALYSKLGYRDVDQVQWEGKRYRSTIMAKEL